MDFELVKTIAGDGDSTELKHYSTLDEKPYPGISYYRLKMVAVDGSVEYSSIESVEIKGAVQHVKVYPNPAVYDTNIVFTTDRSAHAQLEVTAIDGRLVHTQALQIQEGFNKFNLDVTDFGSGHFIIKIENDLLNITPLKFSVKK